MCRYISPYLKYMKVRTDLHAVCNHLSIDNVPVIPSVSRKSCVNEKKGSVAHSNATMQDRFLGAELKS